MNKTIAAIDLGGHDIKLAIPSRGIRRSWTADLYNAITGDGQLNDDKLAVAKTALAEARKIMDDAGVDEVRCTTCSVGRDLDERGLTQFDEMVKSIVHVDPLVIPGEIEGQLGFYGSITGLRSPRGWMAGNVTTIDVGGGSTEIAIGTVEDGAKRTASAPVGGVSLEIAVDGERADLESVLYRIDGLLFDWIPKSFEDPSGESTFVIMGTAAVTLAAWMRGKTASDADSVIGKWYYAQDLVDASMLFFSLTDDEIMETGLVDLASQPSMRYAVLIVGTILENLKARRVIVSDHGLVDAIATDSGWEILRRTRSASKLNC